MAKIKKREVEYTLSELTVDLVSNEVSKICGEVGASGKDTMRYRLGAEECLIGWLNELGEGAKLTLKTGSRFRRPFIDLECAGEQADPAEDESEEFGSYGKALLVNMGITPEYSYDRGVNRVRFHIRKPAPGQITILMIVLALAVLVGVLGLRFIPDGVRNAINSGIITPVYETFFSIIGAIAGPMIFLSVLFGIIGTGDAHTFGRIGKRMMLTFAAMTFIGAIAGLLWAPLIGPELSGGSLGTSQFKEIMDMVLGIIPGNIIEPFSSGNTLQIMFLAVVMGLGLLFLGKRTELITSAVTQLNTLIQFIMSFVCKLIPYFVFVIIVNLIWTGSYSGLVKLWQAVLVMLSGVALIILAYLIFTSVMAKVSPFKIAKKMFPTFMIAITTASSAAAFETNCDTCKNKFGIEPSMVNFGIPLGIVMQKMPSAFYLFVLVVFFANAYGISASIPWYIMVVIVCGAMTIAMPPVPGGAAASYAIVFAQFGIPEEALAVVLTIDLFTDFYLTATDQACLQLSMINIGRRAKMLDQKVLQS